MLTSSEGRINKIPIILFIGLIVASLPFSPLYQGFGYDREIYRYIGMAITKGYLPYRDFFDHKPPGFYFIAAIANLFGPWGFWIVSFVFTFATSLVIFKLAKKHFTSFAFVLAVPLLYIVLSRYDVIYEGGGLTREFTQMFATLIIFLRLRNQRLRFFIVGVLYSFIFFTQPNEILAITLITAYFILWDAITNSFRKIAEIFSNGLFFAAGALTVCAIAGVYLFSNNIFDEFIEQAFLFNINFYSKLSFIGAIRSGWAMFYETFPNFALFAVLYILFAKKNKRFIEAAVVFTAIFIQLYASSIGYHFKHYYLSFIPYFTYCAFFALIHFQDKMDANYYRIAAVAIFFLFILPLRLPFQYRAIMAHDYRSFNDQKTKYYDRVKDIKGQDGQLFVLGNPPFLALNSELNSFSKCKLLYFHFYKHPEFDKDNKMFYEMVAGLKENHCKYIIDCTVKVPIEREELQEYWNSFVSTNYHVKYEEVGWYSILEVN